MATKEGVGEGMSSRRAAEVQTLLTQESILSSISEYEGQYFVLVELKDKERATKAVGLP